jgi:glycine dehydrogenase subunit 1
VYIPVTEEDRRKMLDAIGVDSFSDLLKCIPEELLQDAPPRIGESMADADLERWFAGLAASNNLPQPQQSFLGGGAYYNYIPAVVESIVSRPEFRTAYTPYQAEVSQGTLQAIYEFQSHISNLTDMDLANASLYEGGSALMEGCNICLQVTRRKRLLLPASINPRYLNVLRTYFDSLDIELVTVPLKRDTIDLEQLQKLAQDDCAAIAVQSPNFFGSIEDDIAVQKIVQPLGIKYISVFDPIALGVMRTPGEIGADIAVGEGQSVAVPVSFGGPYLGLIAARNEYVRKMPGRLIGTTDDADGNPGFVLTHQTREQHIRREKATSNICSNQALVALSATIYLSLIGEKGITGLAEELYSKGVYLQERLCEIPGVNLWNSTTFFREFVIELPEDAEQVLERLRAKGLQGGIALNCCDMPGHLLVATHELHTRNDLDRLVDEMSVALAANRS